MLTYLLDTNIVSYLADRAPPFHQPTKRHLNELPQECEIAISILTLYELTYGFFYDPVHSRLLSILTEEPVRVVPLTEAAAETFAALKHAYRRQTGARERTV